jgi:predicted phage replisome organizer
MPVSIYLYCRGTEGYIIKKIRSVKYMRERKYVKLRVDMYEDTKFKIIDMKPERDVIHYIWNRIVLLAGKVNLEGELFLSKNIPYTIETLAIEFNREASQIKLALELFIELQMIELIQANVYKVKNFAKHQNIKVKEKEVAKHKEAVANNATDQLSRNLEIQVNSGKDEEPQQTKTEKRASKFEESKVVKLKIANKASAKAEANIEDKINVDTSQKNNSILFDTKKSRKRTKNKKDNLIEDSITNEEFSEEEINGFTDGDRPLPKDEAILLEWSFG